MDRWSQIMRVVRLYEGRERGRVQLAKVVLDVGKWTARSRYRGVKYVLEKVSERQCENLVPVCCQKLEALGIMSESRCFVHMVSCRIASWL